MKKIKNLCCVHVFCYKNRKVMSSLKISGGGILPLGTVFSLGKCLMQAHEQYCKTKLGRLCSLSMCLIQVHR